MNGFLTYIFNEAPRSKLRGINTLHKPSVGPAGSGIRLCRKSPEFLNASNNSSRLIMKKSMTVLSVILGLSVLACPATAGNINSPAPPSAGSGMITTQQLHDYLTGGEAPAEPGNFKEPVTGPGSTGKSIQEIYEGIKNQFDDCQDIVPEDVRSGVTFFSTGPDFWGPTAGQLDTGKGVGEACSNSSECRIGTVCAQAYQDDDGVLEVLGYCPGLIVEPTCVSLEDYYRCLQIAVASTSGGDLIPTTFVHFFLDSESFSFVYIPYFDEIPEWYIIKFF
jgi:hypothetical protein